MVVWLTDNLGTAPCREDLEGDIIKVDLTDLVEGRGNNTDILATRILESTRALRAGRKVVVCCDRGIVRSNTFAIAILMSSGLAYREAVRLVSRKVGAQAINIDLLGDLVGAVSLLRT